MNCNRYEAAYPNKRTGVCKFLSIFGQYGCDKERTQFCEHGPEVEPCDCPRCSGEGYQSGYVCPDWDDPGWTWDDEDEKVVQNCTTCRVSNTWGKYGCPRCKD